MTALSDLHTRLQSLDGPCRETDAMIAVVFQFAPDVFEDRHGEEQIVLQSLKPHIIGYWNEHYFDDHEWQLPPAFTSSLDAAIALTNYLLPDHHRRVSYATAHFMFSEKPDCAVDLRTGVGPSVCRSHHPHEAIALLLALTSAMMEKEAEDV